MDVVRNALRMKQRKETTTSGCADKLEELAKEATKRNYNSMTLGEAQPEIVIPEATKRNYNFMESAKGDS